MAGYVGKVQIGNNTALIGSTLYGICKSAINTSAKKVDTSQEGDNSGKFINNNYDNLIQGSTIHIKFVNGNSVTSGLTLQVGSTAAKDIVGSCVCEAGTIISFTLDENEHWVVNDNVDNDTKYTFSEGTTNGAFSVSVNGASATPVNVHGLGAAAYKGSTTSINSNSTNDEFPTAATVYSYVQTQTGGLAGLTGAMHFRGIATVAVTDGGTENPTIGTYDFGVSGANALGGDVVIYGQQEYVWTADGTNGHWELLGDEGSYALKSNTDTITEVSNFTTNTLPQLTVTTTTIPNVTTAGTATTASVSGGILTITPGQNTVLGTDISVGSASGWDAGSQASLTTNDTTVVVPGTSTT